MAAVPFAISIHHFISTVGSDAGFASIIGLAILVLLFFAQARETSTLRDQAADSAQRVEDLESRLAQLSRSQVAPAAAVQQPGVVRQPAAVRPGATAPGRTGIGEPVISRQPAAAGAGAALLGPAAPAGVGAPALAAATRLIPAGAPAVAGAAVSVAAGAAAVGVPRAAAGVARAAGGGGSSSRTATIAPDAPIDQTAVGSLPPSTPAAGGNGVSGEHSSPAPVRSPAPPPPRIQIRPDARGNVGRRPPTAPPPRAGDPGRSVWGRFVLLLAALAVVGVVAALLILTSGGNSTQSNTSSSRSTTSSTKAGTTGAAPINPSSVTIAVLNGTATSGLAHRVATQLASKGYKQGNIGNTADQTRTSTLVAYTPGHKRAAQAVAASLKLPSSAVQPVDPNTQAIACPPPATCTATVVVTVGSDLAAR